jgi:uncharacterized linocin/CFP29 family protein
MTANFGRDKVWNQQIWSDVDKAVQEEVGRIRVAQKVFPSILLPSGQPVPTDKLSTKISGVLMIPEGPRKPLAVVSMEFALTQSQVDNEDNQHTGRTLAKKAANMIAATEDALLFQGNPYGIKDYPQKVQNNPAGVQNNPAGESFFAALGKHDSLIKIENAESLERGFLGQHDSTRDASYLEVENIKTNPADIVTKIGQGIGKLREKSHVGPYALFLSSEKFADVSAPTREFNFGTPADRINPLVTGGFYGTGSLSNLDGLLVSLGGEPTTIYIGTDTITEFTQIDPAGRYRFRVFERFQSVVREPSAFVRLKFLDDNKKQPPTSKNAVETAPTTPAASGEY